MKGILLAGGKGTRLYPLTKSISKQLLPVYNKPGVFYPLSTLMLAGIKEILIISTPRDIPFLKDLLGEGSDLGLSLSYAIQDEPKGIAEAFLIGADFIGSDPVCLLLGDNLFYGHRFPEYLMTIQPKVNEAYLFGYHVNDPSHFGVAEFDGSGRVLSLEEKPKNPKSHWAVTGLYFYDSSVVSYAKKLKPSKRGELEITDLNNLYLKEGRVQIKLLGRGMTWLDTGSFEGLLAASQFVHMIEERQGLKIACLEEIAFHNGWIDQKALERLIEACPNQTYRDYLKAGFVGWPAIGEEE
jgi:glucose-1-phosphate thymidylyltransferase